MHADYNKKKWNMALSFWAYFWVNWLPYRHNFCFCVVICLFSNLFYHQEQDRQNYWLQDHCYLCYFWVIWTFSCFFSILFSSNYGVRTSILAYFIVQVVFIFMICRYRCGWEVGLCFSWYLFWRKIVITTELYRLYVLV